MKNLICLPLLILIISDSYSQVSNSISIRDIYQRVDEVANTLKKDGHISEMYIINKDNGDRWLFIENQSFDVMSGDEHFLSLDLSAIIVSMIYGSFNYFMEKSISLRSFTNVLLSKNIQGVQFRAKNKSYFFDWNEIIEKNNSK